MDEEIEKAATKYACMTNGHPGYDPAIRKAYIDGANYALGKQEKGADTVIQGWVARDENKKLFIYTTTPKRKPIYWENESCWVGDVLAEIDATLFPDLTWESEPQECEIIIKRKKK